MENNMDGSINGRDEKILFQRANPSTVIVENNTNESINSGVLVIDPNKVVNDYGSIVDRYVKQEDLVIYSTLKVIKKGEQSVTVKADGSKNTQQTISEPIYINFLNPLTNKKKNNGTYIPKGKFTSEWTDFFTSDASNEKGKEGYLLDPETFGISDINIVVNANNLPRVRITFIDVQGRMLFERGNDVDNPYNIFFTYPYPKFLLTYKGYYGKAVETPLILHKSNTQFDPQTGNYTITAEFESEIFALFNTFLIIYAYVVPYMFPLDSGGYLGKNILDSLYLKQNIKLKEIHGSNYSKYDIRTNPTIYDLSKAIINIPSSVVSTSTSDSANNHDRILKIKYSIESYDSAIKDYLTTDKTIKYKDITSRDNNNQVFTPITSEYFINAETPIELNGFISEINVNINYLKDIVIKSKNITVIDEVKRKIKTEVLNEKYKTVINSDLIIPELFYYNYESDNWRKNPKYSINDYNKVMNYIYVAISDAQSQIENTYIEDQIKSIGDVLGYEPNLNNILRIISNNMQVFLILLDIIGKNSIKQLESDNNRINKQTSNGNYKESLNKDVKYFSPFPNYYENITENLDLKTIQRNVLAYPGIDKINNNWFEVAFVEEIYEAIRRIKLINNPESINDINAQPTGLLTLFQLGENDLKAYDLKKNASKILGELISKYNLYMSYSGIYTRGIELNNINDFLISDIVNFENDLIEKSVFDKMDSNQSKFVLYDQLTKATKNNTTNDIKLTNLSNFIYNFIGVKSSNGFGDIIDKLISLTSKEFSKKEFYSTINELDLFIKNIIKNKYLYELITYKDFKDINSFSINGSKKEYPVSIYPELSYNNKFYCDNSQLLNKISSILYYTEDNNNQFGGFYENLNSKLKTTKINTNFSRTVKYYGADLPALTFNSKMEDFANDERPFEIVTPPEKSYYKIYNEL